MLNNQEKLPISDFYTVLNYQTISRSSRWWSFIVLIKARNKKKIGLYLFQKKNDEWKRKHKFTISSREEYEDIKKVLGNYSKNL
ncbi:MAG: hypothetical protein HGN29_01555 [Asgard group archaeon]|nr:hypothetical protein [Asgard group archaeon]